MTIRKTWLAQPLGGLAALILFGGLPTRAQAQPVGAIEPYQPTEPPGWASPQGLYLSPAPVPAKRWYGYQLMLADAAWVGLAVASGPKGGLFALSYLVAPPIIHGVHHNVAMAVASPLIRSLVPVLGAVIGARAESCPAHDEQELDFCGLGGAIAGFGIGMLVAMVVDYSLAWETVAAAPAPSPPRSYSRVSLSSAGVAPLANGAAVVLGGRF